MEPLGFLLGFWSWKNWAAYIDLIQVSMVNHNNAEVFASDSKCPSASSDHRFEVNRILGYGEIQDTEPIDDDSSSFQMLYDDTELVYNGDWGDEETLDHQLVDDSEDEDGSVASAEPTCLLDRSFKAADILVESDGSKCETGKQEANCDLVIGFQASSRIAAGSHGPGLDYLDSQEPGESTQEEALGFVDQFLMDKDLKVSPVNLPETRLRRKSPPFSGAQGRQSLVKRIKTISPTKKIRVFDWDNDHCDVSGPQNFPVTRANFKKREDHGKDDDHGVKKASMDPCEDRKVSVNSTKRFMQNTSAKYYKMEQTSGLSQGGIMFISEMDAQLQDKASEEQSESEEDFVDIDINTHIVAEAMSTLLYTVNHPPILYQYKRQVGQDVCI